ncbi:CYTH domain-containing protein [Acidihalobacter ferrooxydans]|uniref:Adenylate cyclase n=1 Tax=Acidihalobacter ferrooxydans TaxID=1765967 RepID=A0A1P8UFR7_9GAMM|nr:CYTH domain-containing protein [Acidihalobacter ferrooxydans]APZ42670.1 adenylate cyclase [Acidihalobacter ferrooxydans]
MASEIERKFLIKSDAWTAAVSHSVRYRQGYLGQVESSSVRVRVSDTDAYLNIKSASLGIERLEYEYTIPLADAHEMLDQLCRRPLIEKTRHWVEHAGHRWEIDVFEGDNAGLVVAEIELESPDETFERPVWLGAEVSHEPRYYNVCLVDRPYSVWSEAER